MGIKLSLVSMFYLQAFSLIQLLVTLISLLILAHRLMQGKIHFSALVGILILPLLLITRRATHCKNMTLTLHLLKALLLTLICQGLLDKQARWRTLVTLSSLQGTLLPLMKSHFLKSMIKTS